MQLSNSTEKRLLKEEVDAEDIAEAVAKVHGHSSIQNAAE